jgi:hypothetical protein
MLVREPTFVPLAAPTGVVKPTRPELAGRLLLGIPSGMHSGDDVLPFGLLFVCSFPLPLLSLLLALTVGAPLNSFSWICRF